MEGHTSCRLAEFSRWPRVFLEHERQYLSTVLAEQGWCLKPGEANEILHEITDLDWLLSQIS